MYRLDRRDLGLYLFDSNNRPARDVCGRLIVPDNKWGPADQVTLNDTDTFAVSVFNSSDCVDISTIHQNVALGAALDGQVMDAGEIYEARMSPLLLHEDFASYAAGAVTIGPSGTLDGW